MDIDDWMMHDARLGEYERHHPCMRDLLASDISAYATARRRICATTSQPFITRIYNRVKCVPESGKTLLRLWNLHTHIVNVLWQILVLCPTYIYVWPTQTVIQNLHTILYSNEDFIGHDSTREAAQYIRDHNPPKLPGELWICEHLLEGSLLLKGFRAGLS